MRSGSAEEVRGRQTWIGDQDGFSAFQAAQSLGAINLSQAEVFGVRDLSLCSALAVVGRQFSRVLADQSVPGVGDFYTMLLSDNRNFRFVPSAQLFFDADSVLGRYVATGQNRTYRFSVLAPDDGPASAAGFFFPAGKVSFIFTPSALGNFADNCEVLRDDDAVKICALALARTGIGFDYIELARDKS